MTNQIDAYAVLGSIASHARLFRAASEDATKAAHAIPTKQLKNKATALADVRAIRDVLGADPFELIIDRLKGTDVKTLVKRLDPHLADQGTMSEADRLRHLLALSRGIEPAGKPTASPRLPRSVPKKPGKAPVERALSSKSMKARSRPRGTETDP